MILERYCINRMGGRNVSARTIIRTRKFKKK